ncbi:Protein phosphatase [Parasponia andersonii]|uniref:Protein phosphatase n=1 Tax=Parasponia andersonii TaxID=3476 RepID=A0A2P5AHY6_PARAD|nr:Protein phosphatase [Parasponia andersonii]
MVDIKELIWGFSILYLVLHLFQGLKRFLSHMALTLKSPPPPTSSNISSLPSNLSLVGRFFVESYGGGHLVSFDEHGEEGHDGPKNLAPVMSLQADHQSPKQDQINQRRLHHQKIQNGVGRTEETLIMEEKECNDIDDHNYNYLQEKSVEGSVGGGGDCESSKGGTKLRKRPSRLVVPEYLAGQEFCEKGRARKLENQEFEVEGRDFFLAAKKGRRETMEDGYGVLLDIMGDPTQAFFVVIDGHGGRAATDYVAKYLGNNIVKGLELVTKDEDHKLEEAFRGGYLVTDKEFLSQGVSSGACAASVFLKDGDLHVANVGDCRVVLSRQGVAEALTNDHRLSREDERLRIENSGGFVHYRNGVWRVQGSLAVSRAIGDQHLKDWIISEPEIKSLRLSSDCEFLIVASDGLWDKVHNQEAVDVVIREKSVLKACKKLVDMSSSRGNLDDITVMVINLQNFVATRTFQ